MSKVWGGVRRQVTGVGLAALAVAALPRETAAQTYTRSWDVCGGTVSAFSICAAVNVLVQGTTTTLTVWNKSGTGSSANAASWVITNIGFDDVGATVNAVTSPPLTMSGPVRAIGAVADTPSPWKVYNDLSKGGGINVDLGTVNGNGVNNGIISSCALASSIPNGSNEVWASMVSGCATLAPVGARVGIANPLVNAGAVQIRFATSAVWNPTAPSAVLYVKGQNGPGGASTQCIAGPAGSAGNNCFSVAVVPEPATFALAGTGLLGLGLVGVLRRRG